MVCILGSIRSLNKKNDIIMIPIIILYSTTFLLQKAHKSNDFYVIKKIIILLNGSKIFLKIKVKYYLDYLTVEQLEKLSRVFFQYLVTVLINWLLWKILSFFMALTLEKLGFFSYMGKKFIKLFNSFDSEIQVFCSIFAQEMERILASRAVHNPLSRKQWEEFFYSTLTESEEGIEIFRSLVIEIIEHTILPQPIQTIKMVMDLDSSGEFILLPRHNTQVENIIQSMEKSTILWQFSRYCKGYDFNELMKMLKSHYSGHLPYQFSMVKRYLEFLKKSLVIVIITTSKN